jgi:predicted kinase
MSLKSIITEAIVVDNMFDIESEMMSIKESILEQLVLEGVDDPGVLKCVFMAGGPGSGKSFIASEIFGVDSKTMSSVSTNGLKLVNSDSAFEKGLKDNGINPKDLGKIEKEDPELWDMIAGDDNKNSIRAHAKKLTDTQRAFYEAGRLGLIIDGTGDEVTKIKKKKDHAESLGYDCYMVFVNTSLEVALKRNADRDRTLPEDLVKKIWKDCQNNLGAFQGMFGSNFIIVDNTSYSKNVYTSTNKKTGNVSTYDKPIAANIQKSIDQFLRKPIYNPIGKKWLLNARALKSAGLLKK